MKLLRSVLSGSSLALRACWLWACVTTVTAAEPAKVGSYQEDLQLKWGKVAVSADGNRTRDAWYAVRAPTFTADNDFDAAELAILSEAFDRATRGQVNGQTVWRIDSITLAAFKEGVEKSARLNLPSMVSPLKVPIKGSSLSRKWTLDIEWSRPTVSVPPGVELTLQVAGITKKEAVRVSLVDALHHPAILEYAGLSAVDRDAIVAGAEWMDLFLVAPGTLEEGSFPVVKDATPEELKEYAIPIAYGLCALGRVARILGTDPDRVYSDDHNKKLEDDLSGDHPFKGTEKWFPQVGQPGRLNGADVKTNPLVNLVVVRHPVANSEFKSKRVQRDDEWVILVGPFPRMTRANAVVGFITGEKSVHAVADLPKLMPDKQAREQYERDLQKLNGRLEKVLDKYHMQDGDFFWRDRVQEKNANVMREMRQVSFISNVSAEFDDTGVTYTATYTLAKIEGKIGLSTDPEHGFGSTGEVKWTGLIKPSDTFSLSVTADQHSINGTLDYRAMIDFSNDDLKSYWYSIPVRAAHDDRFLLRDVSVQPFANQTFSGGAEYEYRVKAPISQDGKREPWNAVLKTALLAESFRLTADGMPGAIRDAGLLLRHTQVWTFHPKSDQLARVIWEHEVSPTLTWAPKVGWDSAFGTAEVSGTSTAKFGGEPGVQEDALYTRFQMGIGMSTGTLPAGYRFRFGDSNRLMGLEPGEFSGRSYAYGELLYGANLGYLFGHIFPDDKKTSEGKPDAGADSGPPPALAQMSLELLAEFGRISQAGGFGLFDHGHNDISSYGISLRKAAADAKSTGVRVGYAWSPEGMHQHGRFFMSADMKF